MSFSKEDRAFFDWLDEQPCTSNGVLVRTANGETRNVSRALARQVFEFRSREQAEHRSPEAFPRLERAQNLLAILAYQLEREERDEP